ncbi:MAG: low temperature requirement protein A [Candidatus Thiodiazotropha endolucinida]
MSIANSMPVRKPFEPHRAATPLELFYDLVSVIAIAAAASLLHHGLANNHTVQAVLLFLMTFWTIWWAWMNFTWFASAHDSDDVPYRIAVLLQIVGALVMAAGIRQVFDELDFRPVFYGFVIMRLSLVGLWLRVAASDQQGRPAALRNAMGIALCQAGWALVIFVIPNAYLYVGFVVLVMLEHSVPLFAERAASSTWHRGHIIERFGLLTIIVLGESMLAIYVGIQALIEKFDPHLLGVLVGGILCLFTMWWMYFSETKHHILSSTNGAFIWGYGHFAIFASVAAVGAGLAVTVDQWQDKTDITITAANACVSIPMATFLLALLFLHEIPAPSRDRPLFVYPFTASLVLLTSFIEHGVLIAGLILAALVLYQITNRPSEET